MKRLSPLRDFLRTEAAGGALLVAGTIVALAWANSPWSGSYESFWTSELHLRVAGQALELDLRHWLNDGLMTIFFFVVGLEIKRELVDGHLSTRRTASLPIACALGGMVVPALLYLAIAGRSAADGWAVPVATDIALAVGIVTVVGARVSAPNRTFLLGLAVVDDIGAIVVIAIFYASDLSVGWLLVAIAGVVATVVARRVGVRMTWPYIVIGVAMWLGLHEGGIHATLAGVAMGLLTPATPSVDERSESIVERLERLLHPWTGYLIVPVFAVANAGIEVSTDGLCHAVRSPITWGIVVGLVVGKPIGIDIARRLATRAGLAATVPGTTARVDVGLGAAAGIGFTVALFIAELAFDDATHQRDAKLGILVASVIAAGLSLLVLRGAPVTERTADLSSA